MGACNFQDDQFGYDALDAYSRAVEVAHWEYGHDPYNGTISTTRGFTEVEIPKGLTPDEFVSMAWDYRDYGDITNPAIKRKFSSEWERRNHLEKRARFKKWSKLDAAGRQAVRQAATFSKWEHCTAFKLPPAQQKRLREMHNTKGKRGAYYRFFGLAAI